MKRTERIAALTAALIFTIVGYLQIDQEQNIVLASLSFFAAAVFLYQALGRNAITACTFSAMNRESKNIVVGGEKATLTKNQAYKVIFVTFLAVAVCFGIGFGTGKLIYHFIH